MTALDRFDFITDILARYDLITATQYRAGDFTHYMLVRYKILQGPGNQVMDGLYFGPIKPNLRGDVNGFYNPPYSQVYLSENNFNMLGQFVSLQTSNITAVGNFIAVVVYPLKRIPKPKTSLGI